MTPTARALLLLACGCIAPVLGGGTQVDTYFEPTESLFGWTSTRLGDVDLDGVADFAIGASNANADPLVAAGSVSVYSGATRSLLYRIRGDQDFQYFGRSIAPLDDVDADGRADFVVGAPSAQSAGRPAGFARVCSGLDGSEIRRVTAASNLQRFAEVLANVGDIDGDGSDEFASGAPGVTGATTGESRVFSSATGIELTPFNRAGPSSGSNLGHGYAALGDVNGDGTPDFAVSAPSSDPLGRGRLHIGEVLVISGADGSLIRRHVGRRVGEDFGYGLAAAGDHNRDGVTDLVIGAYGARAGQGEITIWSGRNGRRLKRYRGVLPRAYLGLSVASIGDVDGDGRNEIVGGSNGAVIVIGSRLRRPISVIQNALGDGAGEFLSPLGDLDGDQLPELLVGGLAGNRAQIIEIDGTALALPAPLRTAATFQAQGGGASPPTGTLNTAVAGANITITFRFARLAAPPPFYTLELEDGVGAGTYHSIGFLNVTNGRATVVLAGQYVPPTPLGVATLAQLSGRRVELRQGATVVLALTLP